MQQFNGFQSDYSLSPHKGMAIENSTQNLKTQKTIRNNTENQLAQEICINVLKHIPRALSVLDKQIYEPLSARCLYQIPLSKQNQNMASNYQLEKTSNMRLFGVQQHHYEHQKMKQKISKVFRNINRNSSFQDKDQDGEQIQKYYQLAQIYSSMQTHYSRFINNHNKKNFASLIMSVNGVNVLQSKKNNSKKLQIARLITPTYQNQNSKSSVRFDSHFECGNLLYVYQRQSSVDNPKKNPFQTYDLIVQNDINTKGHNQWFYFKAHNSSSRKNLTIKLNIVNFIKKHSLFNNGMKILTFSQKRFQKSGKGWMRQGQKITYEQNGIKRQNKDGFHYSLSFEYTFRDQNDTVYFCPSYPYAYTQLTKYLQQKFRNTGYNKCMTIRNIAQTVGGNPVNMLTISTGRAAQVKAEEQKNKDIKIVWILARQHPCQTTGSFMVQGIIDYLSELMSKSRNSCVQQTAGCMRNWLDYYVFKIIPMINIDGVIHGNSRSLLTGVDSNRIWQKPYLRLAPQINSIKKAILQHRENVDLVIDLHSHSKKTGCFFYGNTVMHNPKICKVYPTFVCENDQRFTIKNCRFRGGYDTTMRKVLFSELSNPNVFTVECSLYGYQKNGKIVEYSIQDFRQMGKKLVQSYIQLEKQKNSKKLQQIIIQHNIIYEARDQCESARSDSSLSDQQYQQIYKKNQKNKKNNKFCISKKTNKSKNNITNKTIIQPEKIRVNQISTVHERTRSLIKNMNGKLHMKRMSEEKSFIKREQPLCKKVSLRNNDASNYQIKKKQSADRNKISFQNQKYDSLLEKPKKLFKNLQPKGYLLNSQVLKQGTIVEETNQIRKKTKNCLSQAIQVQITVDIKQHILKTGSSQSQLKQKSTQSLPPRKKDKVLCVVGNAIEDERGVFLCGKNEIAIQTQIEYRSQQLQKQWQIVGAYFGQNKANTCDVSVQGPSHIKQSKSSKIPKIINFLCNNMGNKVKQNALLPNDKHPLLQRNQKRRPRSNHKNVKVSVSFRN